MSDQRLIKFKRGMVKIPSQLNCWLGNAEMAATSDYVYILVNSTGDNTEFAIHFSNKTWIGIEEQRNIELMYFPESSYCSSLNLYQLLPGLNPHGFYIEEVE